MEDDEKNYLLDRLYSVGDPKTYYAGLKTFGYDPGIPSGDSSVVAPQGIIRYKDDKTRVDTKVAANRVVDEVRQSLRGCPDAKTRVDIMNVARFAAYQDLGHKYAGVHLDNIYIRWQVEGIYLYLFEREFITPADVVQTWVATRPNQNNDVFPNPHTFIARKITAEIVATVERDKLTEAD